MLGTTRLLKNICGLWLVQECRRVCYESLAMRYRTVFAMLEDLQGSRLDTLHVVGGGCQNILLNPFTASALQRTVVAGPVEATSAGNMLMQMYATGAIDSLAEGRALIRRSFDLVTYTPGNTADWDEAWPRFKRIETEG